MISLLNAKRPEAHAESVKVVFPYFGNELGVL